jgi:hypothetical protein
LTLVVFAEALTIALAVITFLTLALLRTSVEYVMVLAFPLTHATAIATHSMLAMCVVAMALAV